MVQHHFQRHSLLAPAQATTPDAVIAWRRGKPVTRARFLQDTLSIAERLPAHAHVINVCDDRYLFMVGLAAAVLRGQVSLFPPTRAPGVVLGIATEYPDSYLLSDNPTGDGALPLFRISLDTGESDSVPAGLSVPQIELQQLVAILFTSGSTGQVKPNRKSWEMLVRGAATNAKALLPVTSGPLTVVATVPSQHMYGFETTIMLPLQGYCAMQCDRPLYPEDVRQALTAAPEPRFLVTTPVHLRSLLESSTKLPALAGILCATAPLTQKLAAACEAKFGTPITDAFGCTEAGIIASRRTTQDDAWHLLELFEMEAQATDTLVHATHLPEPIVMQDVIDVVDDRHFRLVGRSTDLINIAGKRASLGDLNTKLLSIEGVRDGIIFMPETSNEDQGTVRTAAFVVAPGMTREQVLAALRQMIDPAFLPRPLFLVDTLPRTESSKLPRAAVLELFAAQMRS